MIKCLRGLRNASDAAKAVCYVILIDADALSDFLAPESAKSSEGLVPLKTSSRLGVSGHHKYMQFLCLRSIGEAIYL